MATGAPTVYHFDSRHSSGALDTHTIGSLRTSRGRKAVQTIAALQVLIMKITRGRNGRLERFRRRHVATVQFSIVFHMNAFIVNNYHVRSFKIVPIYSDFTNLR